MVSRARQSGVECLVATQLTLSGRLRQRYRPERQLGTGGDLWAIQLSILVARESSQDLGLASVQCRIFPFSYAWRSRTLAGV